MFMDGRVKPDQSKDLVFAGLTRESMNTEQAREPPP